MSEEKDILEEDIVNDADAEEISEDNAECTDDDEISELTKSLEEEKNKYLRLFAEYDNYRKRTAKEKSEAYGDATARTINDILPALDNFERAVNAETTDESYKNGTMMIFNQLKDIIAKLGVTEIEALGAEFDPRFHQAIKQEESEDYEENIVCQVFQKGYMLGERLIRPAMVAVAQ